MGTFGFIIHPIEVQDVARKFPAAKYVPNKLVEWLMSYMPPIKASEITGVKSPYGDAQGWFVSCPLTPRLMLGLPEEKVLGKISDAVNAAADLGAKIVGLGAFTAVVGDAGLTVRRNVDVPVTTGNSYTAYTALEATEKAAGLMGHSMDEANVLVLGATGSIGKVLSLIMADQGRQLTLCARNSRRLEKASSEVREKTGMVPRIDMDLKRAVKNADVIICVSSAMDAVIEAEDLKPGAVVCDVSRPRNVSLEVKKKRDDVLIIEGGVVEVPGDVNFNLDFGFPKGTSYACMAETMILAMEERYTDWSLGRDLFLDRVVGIQELAKKHGFKIAGFRSFERAVSDEQIEAIRMRAAKKNRKITA